MKKINVGIFLFNEVEVLDFAGPFEVFSLAEKNNMKCCNVMTIAEQKGAISARNGLKVCADFDFNDTFNLDVLIVPGGYGAEEVERFNPTVIDWVKAQKKEVDILASVCTGAFILAEAGLLNGRRVTTHWMDTNKLAEEYKDLEVISDVKYIDEGEIVTSAGISAGINMSFGLLERLLGKTVASAVAKRMEYDIEL